jgi:hypothetical protein
VLILPHSSEELFLENFVAVMIAHGYGQPDAANTANTAIEPHLDLLLQDVNCPLRPDTKRERDAEEPVQGPAAKRVKMEHDDGASAVQMPPSMPPSRHWVFADQPPSAPPENPVNRGQEKILEGLGMHV